MAKPPISREDEEGFQRLFARYYRPVGSFFVGRGFSADEAQELAQETFLQAYRGIARFRGDSSSATWLFSIAANLWRNQLRSRTAMKRDRGAASLGVAAPTEEAPVRPEAEREPLEEARAGDLASPERGPLDEILTQERVKLRRQALRQAIDELPLQMRQCVLLRVYQELAYREIAATMQVSIDTVKSHLSQARVRLKAQLAKEFPDLEIS